ncbi:MAG: siderophore-interacting protein [Acidimicrobiia bacterium]|nr:siderophore-interacting protein [Acidimicrobiia bacterium]
MTDSTDRPRSASGRRKPPEFRNMQVLRTEHLTPHMVRVTFGGDDLAGLVVDEPAASVRVLLPMPGTGELVVPEWNGNEFLLPDGNRPPIRTFTPRRAEDGELDIDMVIHEGGLASTWALQASPGDPAAVSGPGRGYTIDPGASGYLLAGDETAIPAISQLLEAIPSAIPVQVHVEVAAAEARLDLPGSAEEEWHLGTGDPGATLVDAVAATDITESNRVWCAGEAAAMHKIRNNLFKERGLPRSIATVRGYWKRPRPG